MRIYLLLILLSQSLNSQTTIRLTSPSAEKKKMHGFTQLSDTLFVKVRHSEDMGHWGGFFYDLKPGVPDGEYIFLVDNLPDQKMVVKNGVKSGIQTRYYPNGTIAQLSTYQRGELHGSETRFDEQGKMEWMIQYINGKYWSRTDFYPSGRIRYKETVKGDSLIKQEFPDKVDSTKFECNTLKPGIYKVKTAGCATMVLLPDSTCYFEKTKARKKITGTWKVDHCTLTLLFDAVRDKSPIEIIVDKNGKQPKKVHYNMFIQYKIVKGTLVPKTKTGSDPNYSCGTYELASP